MRLRSILLLAPLLVSCASSGGFKVDGGGNAVEKTGAGPELAGVRFRNNVCEGIDLKPDYGTLDEKSLVSFLKEHGFETKVERARNDLVYVDVSNAGTKEPVRLRVAILKTPMDAGNELHTAILQHGPGAWGVHRANLAVLGAVAASDDDALAFAAKTKLACWGVFTAAGRDDTFVVSGAYFEL